MIKTGIDIVYLPRFRASIKQAGENFLKRIFLERELKDQRIEHLAGIFAAKEAAMKALGLPKGCWHEILITNKSDGTPTVQITNYQLPISNYSLSISHDGNYVIAQYVAITG